VRKTITLIQPAPSKYNIFSHLKNPSLGLPILGTILDQKGYDVKIYVEGIKEIDWKRVFESDAVGISVNTATYIEGYTIAERIKRRGIAVIIGGFHVTFFPDEALDYCDYVVRGEGEETIVELLEALEKNSGLDKVRGISYKSGNRKIHNPARELVKNLDIIPDFSLIEGYVEHHRKLWTRIVGESISIMTSRGCPFSCKFCSIIKIFGNSFRFRSIESVIEDIKRQITLLNRHHIFFVDDNFASNKKRTKELLRRIIDERLNITFTAQVRVDIARDEELISLMKRAGCRQLNIGFESIDPRTLEAYNKQQSVKEIVSAIEKLKKFRITVHGMFVLGSDFDDVNTICKTVDFCLRHRIDTVQFLPLTPLPGTLLTEELKEKDRLLIKLGQGMHQDGFGFGVGNYVLFKPKLVEPSILQEEIYKAYQKFYTFRNIVRALLKKKARIAISRTFGKYLVKKAKVEIYEYINWLKQIEVAPQSP